MEQDEVARLRQELRRWSELLKGESNRGTRKILEELISNTQERLARIRHPTRKP